MAFAGCTRQAAESHPLCLDFATKEAAATIQQLRTALEEDPLWTSEEATAPPTAPSPTALAPCLFSPIPAAPTPVPKETRILLARSATRFAAQRAFA